MLLEEFLNQILEILKAHVMIGKKQAKTNIKKAALWVQENSLPNISEEFKKKTENKVLIANARRKYFAGEIKESWNYYEQAKMNGYKATNLSWKLKLRFITDPIWFFFRFDR